MAHKSGRNAEPYTAYVQTELIDYYKPNNLFYTTRTGMECRRFFCATCGDLHQANKHSGQRTLEWVTGTTMPDALTRAREAYDIDTAVQRRHEMTKPQPDITALSAGFCSANQHIAPTGNC